MISLYTKHEVPRCTRYAPMNGNGYKMYNFGQFWAVRSHSRSSAMSPFDKVHMTSYSTVTAAGKNTSNVPCHLLDDGQLIKSRLCQASTSPIADHGKAVSGRQQRAYSVSSALISCTTQKDVYRCVVILSHLLVNDCEVDFPTVGGGRPLLYTPIIWV